MREINYYDFDLDLAPAERWASIFDVYADKIIELKPTLQGILNSFGLGVSLVKPVYHTMANSIMHYDEISYIAKRAGLSNYEVLLLQLIYETSSACTSAVVKVGLNEFYLRTMDWPMLFLKDVTIGLNIKKGGQVIGRAVTWLGYLGFLTATNTVDNYTLAINYRRTTGISLTSLLKNFYRTVSMNWPIGYLVRYIIENQLNVVDAKKLLEIGQLISPCYVTLYVPGHVSSIITRDCDKTVDTRTIDLIQTNCDCGKTEPNILYSLERVKFIKAVQKLIDESAYYDLPSKDILKMLLKFPVLNDETIYVHFQFGDEHKTLV